MRIKNDQAWKKKQIGCKLVKHSGLVEGKEI
jgi:hypothetical protein